MISQESLPEALLSCCLDVMRKLSDEKDLIRMIVEVIQELRDTADEEEVANLAVSDSLDSISRAPCITGSLFQGYRR